MKSGFYLHPFGQSIAKAKCRASQESGRWKQRYLTVGSRWWHGVSSRKKRIRNREEGLNNHRTGLVACQRRTHGSHRSRTAVRKRTDGETRSIVQGTGPESMGELALPEKPRPGSSYLSRPKLPSPSSQCNRLFVFLVQLELFLRLLSPVVKQLLVCSLWYGLGTRTWGVAGRAG